MANKLKRIAIGLIALSMRLDAYAIQRGMTMDAAHPKDPDPKNWRTINGSKVHLTEGKDRRRCWWEVHRQGVDGQDEA